MRMRSLPIVALLALFLGAAAAPVPITLAARAAAPDAVAEAPSALADSIAIRAVVADLDSAWANGDADRWVSHYAPDSEFINILGMLMPSPEAVRKRHREIFTGVFKGSRLAGSLRRVRFLGTDVAIVDVDLELTGFSALPPGTHETRPGVLATRMRHVMTRVGGAWLIAATQNTAVVPMPEKPPEKR